MRNGDDQERDGETVSLRAVSGTASLHQQIHVFTFRTFFHFFLLFFTCLQKSRKSNPLYFFFYLPGSRKK